ncbi:arylesterase [Govanella unica]|uniref:Arylesterase n=1 Tax=Govanella unica TaxID=2975056 RepID=A0A9X3Z612_9PROT|nr:arylesterase [Govania unica]MDA5192661.1 arylesterase [Govania unica]
MTRHLRRSFFIVLCPLVFLLSFPGAARATPTTAETIVVAFGDSLTAGYGLPSTDSIPVRLETLLRKTGHRVTVVNAGVSGDTSSGGRARLDWALASLDKTKPTLVILELGANDALRGIDPRLTADNLDHILKTLKARGIPVLLCGMKAPPNLGRDYGVAFNAIYPALAKKYDLPLYPFFLDGVAAQPRLNQADGMHPNAKGAELIASRLAPIVAPLLDHITRPSKDKKQP